MTKRLFLILFLACITVIPNHVKAEVLNGGSDWAVTFTEDKKMKSNFKDSDIDDVVYGMQPGDTTNISIKLTNKNKATTDWYMSNEAIKSLEDGSKTASGGAYTYKLIHKDPNGAEKVIFDSETVGGEGENPAGEGLNQVTNALKDYFYLCKTKTGESGSVSLLIGLEGETQGNDYQNTLADIQMKFAVELDEDSSKSKDDEHDSPSNKKTYKTTSTKTGDYLIFILILGLVMMASTFVASAINRAKGDKHEE